MLKLNGDISCTRQASEMTHVGVSEMPSSKWLTDIIVKRWHENFKEAWSLNLISIYYHYGFIWLGLGKARGLG